MGTWVPVLLWVCLLPGGALRAQTPARPVLVGVWYGGGLVRPPDVPIDPGAERDAWRRELQTIRSLGFNSISTWVSWASAEPAPGQYRLEALEQLVSLAAGAGLQVRAHVYASPPPPWTSGDPGGLASREAAFRKVVAFRAALDEEGEGQISAGAAATAADLRLWGWAALARGSRSVAFHAWPDLVERDGRPAARARVAGEFAGVITRNPALFAPLRPRQPGSTGNEPDLVVSGDAAEIRASFLESPDALVLVALNYGAEPATVTLTFPKGTKQEFWQNMETGEMVSFTMSNDSPTLTHAFGVRDVLVLMIRKTSPYDRRRSPSDDCCGGV